MNKYLEIVEAAKKYVESNIECAISPEDAAKEINYSLRQLNRIFSMTTGITVGEYIRWSKLAKSLFRWGNVNSWIIVKPDRMWVSGRRNTENLPAGKFYDVCEREGIMRKVGELSNVISIGGAYFPSNDSSRLCFGAEVGED